MVHFVGLDVSVKETSVCVVDDAGKVIFEQKVLTEPADIIALLTSLGVPAAHDALRGRTLTAYPQQEMVVAEGVGHAGGSAARDTSSHRRGRQAPSRGSAPDVGRW